MQKTFICMLFVCFASLSSAVRVKTASKLFARQEDENSSNVIREGLLLRDRYLLHEYSHSHSRATPGISFPSVDPSRGSFENSEHLGTGSFGDVWKAKDTKLGKLVAVKIFYQEKHGVKSYMTWQNADARGKRELKDSAEECTFVKKIMDNRAKYPLGASRICECYEEHINDATGRDVVFLVQEMCGRDLETQFIKPRKESGRVNIMKARKVTKQMLEGLAFLQMFNPPLIHHDLKPANVCMNDNGQVKIIDWGGIVEGTITAIFQPAVATPLYTPPEAKSRIRSFDTPYWSYDAYAVGLMHMELVCPMLDAVDWYYHLPLNKQKIKQILLKKCGNVKRFSETIDEDAHIMASLAAKNPKDRPDPMAFLDDPTLVDVPTPQVREDEKAHVLIFKVNQEVEYWSTTYKEWLSAIVGAVDHVHGTYDLLNPDSRDSMRKQADPSRVRAPQKDLLASVDPQFIPRHSVFDGNEAGGIEQPGLLIPVQKKPPKQEHIREQGPNGEFQLTPAEKEGIANFIKGLRNDNDEKKQVPKQVPETTDIEVETPELYGSSSYGYTIQTFVSGVKVDSIFSVTLHCDGIADIALDVEDLASHLWTARLKLPKGDPRESKTCKLDAIASVQGEKKKSYHRTIYVWKYRSSGS